MTQVLEGVAFKAFQYYDAIHYHTTAGKIKSVSGGLKWLTLTKTHPVIKVNIKIRSKSKQINPYTFMGVLIGAPPVDDKNQSYQIAAETTANAEHIGVIVRFRYNEWNENFNHAKA